MSKKVMYNHHKYWWWLILFEDFFKIQSLKIKVTLTLKYRESDTIKS